jgi:phosphoribosylglycinamide formyltransferase-1
VTESTRAASLARVAVLLSGKGSNFLALHAAMEAGQVPASIVLVLSDKRNAPGLEEAARRGIPSLALAPRDFPDRQAHEEALLQAVQAAEADWICLAGFMRLLGRRFVGAFPDRILNIHPSLLPAFPGLRAVEQAIDYGVRVSGCTVHLVDEGLDSGPIVLQRTVPVLGSDTADSLAQRILAEEHRAYAEALGRLITTPWRLEGRRLIFGAEEV